VRAATAKTMSTEGDASEEEQRDEKKQTDAITNSSSSH